MSEVASEVPPRKPDISSRLAALQVRRSAWVLLFAVVVSVASVPLVRQLRLNTDWAAMLPESKPSVRDLDRIAGRLGGLNTLSVVVQSKDTEALTRFARALVPALEAMRAEAPEVRSVDWNMSAYEDFVRAHKQLYASLEDLREVRNALEDRLVYEKSKANPFFVALDDVPEDPETVIRRLEEKAEKKGSKRLAGGFYLHESGEYLTLFLRTDVRGGDVKRANALIARVDAVVASVGPAKFAPDLRVEYAGELITSREEHDAVMAEVAWATAITVVLVLFAIYTFFRSFRSIPIMGLAIVPPTLLTYAISKLFIGELNTSTAFLGSVVIGNGINPGFNWLARYFEERRRGRDVETAVAETHRGVWRGTLAAAVAASLAYGSLLIAQFRGFRDFGVITGVGMVTCWAGMLLLVPALTAVSERLRPLHFTDKEEEGTLYGRAFWWLASRGHRWVVVAFTLLLGASALFIAVAVKNDPLEYDFRKLRSVGETASRASELGKYVRQTVGKAASGNAIAALVDTPEDARRVRDAFEAHRAKDVDVPYGRVRLVDDLLPDAQGAKIEVLGQIRELLLDMRKFANEKTQARIDENMPAKFIRPVKLEDLPPDIVRPYAERDGALGRVVFIESAKGRSVWDGRYLIEWARQIRGVASETKAPIALAGRAPVFADIVEVVVEDGPKAVLLSFAMTVLLVLITFGRVRDSALTLLSLLVGVTLMAGIMAAFGMKLNFLNFVAFPIAFGNGVDYAVNTVGRFVQERDEHKLGAIPAIERAVAETGGAVILCSLSTVIGYLSLFVSANRAINSFGAAMAISELSCLFAAVLGLPALIYWRATRAAAKAAPSASA